MIRIGPIGGDQPNELERALAKTRDVVTDDILQSEGQKAKREISKTQRTSKKVRAFTKKNRRRNKRRK